MTIEEQVYKANRIQLDILLEAKEITLDEYYYQLNINNQKLYKEA